MIKTKALIERIVTDMVSFIVEDKKVTIVQAMDVVYNSAIFDKLADNETGLYKKSSAYVYALLQDEIANEQIVQNEI
ncbi:MAG: hypothetical protein LBM69_09165 [Lachnospiraceae bacterium]|jgi:hypothetical protein|nr:hypothetical protein [Lachnospiraceae bacterium]